jgi:hypothetical protein
MARDESPQHIADAYTTNSTWPQQLLHLDITPGDKLA